MNLIHRALKPSKNSFFLFGPRGVGKSTWLKAMFEEAFVINLLDPAVFREYSARPERLREAVLGCQQHTIIIDEVQKLPELLSVVHALIEEKQGWQFILTGSSARKLRSAGVNLLGGRAEVYYLHPFMACELGSAFNLNQALEMGLLPVILEGDNQEKKLHAYVALYLKEEVQMEGLVRNIGNFSRFLEVVSFSHAEQLNLSNIARECGISRKIIESYLSILNDLLLSFTLPVFTQRAKRALADHPKFYLFDSGVYRFLRVQGFLDTPSRLMGSALEGLVAQHLRAWNDALDQQYTLSYWRTRAGNEVDFIVYGPDRLWAIEVKANEHIHSRDLSGLNAFCEDYPEAIPILLYRGTEMLQKGKIRCLPVERFLLEYLKL